MGTAFPIRPGSFKAALKARQTAKLKEIGKALRTNGLRHIDGQAIALNLPRSTAWTVIVASHKSSGLSAAIVLRMLRSSCLPDNVRQVIFEYVQEKAAGRYGGEPEDLRRFESRVLAGLPEGMCLPQAQPAITEHELARAAGS